MGKPDQQRGESEAERLPAVHPSSHTTTPELLLLEALAKVRRGAGDENENVDEIVIIFGLGDGQIQVSWSEQPLGLVALARDVLSETIHDYLRGNRYCFTVKQIPEDEEEAEETGEGTGEESGDEPDGG